MGFAERIDPAKTAVVVVWDLCIDAKSFPVTSEVLQALITIRARVNELFKAEVSFRLAASDQ